MIDIKKYKKIYIASIYEKTGGPKTLHQLAEILANLGVDVYMVYFKDYSEFILKENLLYKADGVNLSSTVIDVADNLLIVPEANVDILSEYHQITKVVWWLSLDYYLMINNLYRAKRKLYLKNISSLFFPLAFLYYKITLPKRCQLMDDDFKKIYHLYNCKYIEHYLKNKDVPLKHMHYLCGPLEEFFITLDETEVKKEKKNIVAYNCSVAKVNLKYVNKVIKHAKSLNSEIEFVPIKGMSRDKVLETLVSAKTYLDLGVFPGPERIPREAAASYCNIVASKMGSCNNDEDVPIPSKYKFDLNNINVNKIAKLLVEITLNYEKYNCDFENYRKKTKTQFYSFKNDVENAFEII